jgi:hypothetical protein
LDLTFYLVVKRIRDHHVLANAALRQRRFAEGRRAFAMASVLSIHDGKSEAIVQVCTLPCQTLLAEN